MRTAVIDSGVHAGKTAYIFDSKDELAMVHASGGIADGSVVGFDSAIVPEWTEQGANYGVFVATSGVYAIERRPGWSAYDVRSISLHELPGPGWTMNSVSGTVTGPDGTIYFEPSTIITLIIWIVALILVSVIVYGILAALGILASSNVATHAQLSEDVSLFTYPDGTTETVDKHTGKSISKGGSWTPSLNWVIFGAIAVAGVLVVLVLFKK